jgi:drug/metabolite transporter (DMT)-like permease
MTLTLPIVAAVLFAALLHAVWNTLVKGGSDPLSEMALVTVGASILVIPLLPFVPPLAQAAWIYLGMSIVIHVGYYATLVATYRHADLSVGYPVMRGSAPLLVTLSSLVLLGEQPSPAMWAGIALISAGVLSLAVGRGGRAAAGRAVPYALLNATMIAAYTLVDAAGARSAGTAMSYVVWMFFLEGLPFAALVLYLRRRAFIDYAAERWRVALVGGGCSALAYGIAVWAMTRAPVGAVSALRETSVVFALGLGALALKERLSTRRWLGVAAVLAGAITLRI